MSPKDNEMKAASEKDRGGNRAKARFLAVSAFMVPIHQNYQGKKSAKEKRSIGEDYLTSVHLHSFAQRPCGENEERY